MRLFLFIGTMISDKHTKKKTGDDKVKAGHVLDVQISSIDEEGYGCGKNEDLNIKVMGVLPDEVARVKIAHVSQQRAFAHLVKVLRHSPDRLQSPPCQMGLQCDCCPLIQMKYPAQLAWKSGILFKEIKKYFPLEKLDIRPIIPSPKVLGYRNSAKLAVGGKFAAPEIGIYRRNSHEILDIADCPLHHPLINKVVQAAKEGIRKGKVPIFSARTRSGLLRYLVVRVSEEYNRAMVVLVTAERSYNEIHHLAKYLQGAVPEIAVVVQNVNSSTGNVILGQKDYFLTKEGTLFDSIGNIRFSISPRSFFQINNGGARTIYEQVREFANLTGTEKVIDLYCGVGGISFFLAAEAREVIGIESIAAAVVDAERNAALNGINNCRFSSGDAAALLGELASERTKAEILVMNPPRKGCEEMVLQQAVQLQPARMIYVSCSPSSLARDLSILHRLGYKPRIIQPIDMFPQTPHMENVVLITKD